MNKKKNNLICKPQGCFPKRRNPDFKTSGFRESRFGVIFFVALTVFLVSSFLFWRLNFGNNSNNGIVVISNESSNQNEEQSQNQEVPEEKKERVVSYVIEDGDIPADIFANHGKLNANDIEKLLVASVEIYDFSNLKIGQPLDFIFNKENEEKLERIEYYPNSEKVIIAEADDDNFEVRKEDIPYLIEETIAFVKIDDFLYKDAIDEGLSAATIVEIADIFAFDVDFTTEIREGDELKLVYEKRTLEGEEAPDGRVLAAKFINNGQEYFGYYFESEEGESGYGAHYDADGKELVRQFLRAPLSYSRITSGYTGSRLHPITKKVTAHYQIDYAAPVGTPVVSTAKGTVTSAGWAGGWGKIVRVKHDNGYTTHYAHLSSYGKGIKSGARVAQGQVVGYVGSTGWSTGPHLDYGMKLNGKPVNPLSLKLPKGKPLQEGDLGKFQEMKEAYNKKLE